MYVCAFERLYLYLLISTLFANQQLDGPMHHDTCGIAEALEGLFCCCADWGCLRTGCNSGSRLLAVCHIKATLRFRVTVCTSCSWALCSSNRESREIIRPKTPLCYLCARPMHAPRQTYKPQSSLTLHGIAEGPVQSSAESKAQDFLIRGHEDDKRQLLYTSV